MNDAIRRWLESWPETRRRIARALEPDGVMLGEAGMEDEMETLNDEAERDCAIDETHRWKEAERQAEDRARKAETERDALRAEVERLRMATRGIRSRSGSRESRGGTRRSGSGRDGNSPRTEPGGEE